MNKNPRWGDHISSLAMISDSKEVDFFENTKPNPDSDDDWGHRLTLDPRGRNASARVRSLDTITPSSSPAGAVDLSDSTPDMNWDGKILVSMGPLMVQE